jgi:hypothetical protein
MPQSLRQTVARSISQDKSNSIQYLFSLMEPFRCFRVQTQITIISQRYIQRHLAMDRLHFQNFPEKVVIVLAISLLI